jgi:hypothetical protein
MKAFLMVFKIVSINAHSWDEMAHLNGQRQDVSQCTLIATIF